MGGGTYSTNSTTGMYDASLRHHKAIDKGYYSRSINEIFAQKEINNAMSPYGVRIREARDSSEHPNVVPIILALDVTGSMGSIPHHLVKEGLPEIMGTILQRGIQDPAMLFLAIGDHECDRSPLQVGQFEANDDLLDKWLTDVYLEGGGGGNDGESYLLAWYLGAYHTSIDSFEKRGKKGFLFTIGDEPTLKSVPKKVLQGIMGDGQYEDFSAVQLLDKAREKYHVYHLHIKETSSGSRQSVIDDWKQLLSDNLIIVERHNDVSKIIAETVLQGLGADRTKVGDYPKVPDKPEERPQIIL